MFDPAQVALSEETQVEAQGDKEAAEDGGASEGAGEAAAAKGCEEGNCQESKKFGKIRASAADGQNPAQAQ